MQTVEEIMRAYNRDSLRRAGYTQTDGFYLTPEQAQELMPVAPVSDARYDIIGVCEVCGEDFDKQKHTQRYCSPKCRRDVKRKYDLERYHEVGADNRRERVAEEAVTINSVTLDPYTNLMLAVAKQARDDGDTEWLAENGELYSSAVLGRPMKELGDG